MGVTFEETRTRSVFLCGLSCRPNPAILFSLLVLLRYIHQLAFSPAIVFNPSEIPQPYVSVRTTSQANVIFDLQTVHCAKVAPQSSDLFS